MQDAIIALIIATAALLGSPGPATLALAAVGATEGIKGGLRFYAGILSGLVIVMTGAAIGLATVLAQWPHLRWTIQILGAAYITYIAVRIATAPTIDSNSGARRFSPRMRDGLVLNLLNPKAYAAFLALFGQFLLPVPGAVLAYVSTAVVCFVVAVLVDAVWLVAGGAVRSVFARPRSARIIRVLFAISMVVATVLAITLA